VTNEQYLIVSYFSAAGGGMLAAAITALILRSPVKKAVGKLLKGAGRIFRRVLPIWLILLVLFGFMTVSYFDCAHETYDEIVNDRQHLEQVTRIQASRMCLFLGISLLAYAFAMVILLITCPPKHDKQASPQEAARTE